MRKLILLLLMLYSISGIACDRYVVGFRGINDIFDNDAFVEYADKKKSCYKAFSHLEVDQAVKFISKIDMPYQIYGYSAGARSVGRALAFLKKDKIMMPYYIITIGAYRTADVNFTRYNIEYHNYFDESGLGQRSPGITIIGIGHDKIQKFINRSID
jgi:hypothetical protein